MEINGDDKIKDKVLLANLIHTSNPGI